MIQPSGASVDEARAGLVDAGGPGRDTLLEDRGDQKRGHPDQEAAGDQHAHRREHDERGLMGVLSVFRPGGAQEDRSVDLHEARDGQGADQGQARGGEGRAGISLLRLPERGCRTGPGR